MNVLVLTPDAVGSTLLQRLITVYMQLQVFDKPVINLHELTVGLHSYWHDQFNQTVIGRTLERNYHQVLPDVIDLLHSADHYKISRLAHYHLRQRDDPASHIIPFYEYLNKNFFIIMTKRRNVFEHGLSWCINSFTKKLNVYDAGDKIKTFFRFYKDPVTIDPAALTRYLDAYKDYLDWAESFFSIGSVFCYEDHLPDLEKYILELPVFVGQPKISWQDRFDISFNDWNRYQYAGSCIDYLAASDPTALKTLDLKDKIISNQASAHDFPLLQEQYNQVKDPSWTNIENVDQFDQLPEHIKQECLDLHQLSSVKGRSMSTEIIQQLGSAVNDFLSANKTQYASAESAMFAMQKLNILPGPLPIKKQTLKGKKVMIKNWDQCIEIYNQWQEHNSSVADPITEQSISDQVSAENHLWHTYGLSNLIS